MIRVGKTEALVESARVIFEAPQELVVRLDAEWHRRRLRSRSEVIRVLLAEALQR